MDAGGARVQDRVDEARAEDSAELVARILVGVVGQRREQVFGDLDASQVLDAAQAGRVGRGQQARDDRDGDASAARELDEGSVDVGLPEELCDRERGARCLLNEEALDLLLRGRPGSGVTGGECGDRDRQGLEGGA